MSADENRARHADLPRPPSKTIQRPADTCRVLVTVEVKLSKEMMDSAKSYHLYDATDVMRAAFANYTTIGSAAEVLDEMRHDGDLTVLSTKIEPNK